MAISTFRGGGLFALLPAGVAAWQVVCARRWVHKADPAVCTGSNIYKDGSDAEIKPDSEYPDWVFSLHMPDPTMEELRKKFDEHGADELTDKELKRLVMLENRAKIKENNLSRAKK